MYSNRKTMKYTKDYWDDIEKFKEAVEKADAVVVGAGAGLSTSAGFTYTGRRFEEDFGDFIRKYHFTDMYSGGFYPFDSLEEHWAYWSRYVYINRYRDGDNGTYKSLFELVKDKDYFVLTTNVDHQFQKAGFDKKRIFYTQGDYGLFQCSKPCHDMTYDNRESIEEMLEAQGYVRNDEGKLYLPEGDSPLMTIPTELVPKCPKCGRPMTMNLRADDTFVQDKGWYVAGDRYSDFIRRHRNLKVMYLELGVGMNTPCIIKYPFWRMTAENPEATYVCLNYGEACAPLDIKKQSLCINGDIREILTQL